jgi:uncharacterized C2H2 Zn-finger protein
MTTDILSGRITSFSIEAITVCCAECGIPFSMPKNYQQELRESHQSFYCPSGHGNHYPEKNKADILQEKLNQKQNEIAQLSASKVQLEAQLQKVAAGKCPCCGKLYKHLQSHMKNKHPHALKK